MQTQKNCMTLPSKDKKQVLLWVETSLVQSSVMGQSYDCVMFHNKQQNQYFEKKIISRIQM